MVMESDANRQQAEKKVLRAQDIIPSSNLEQGQANLSQSLAAEMAQTAVPQFNLAAEIMAQQRKITAARRKRPGNGTQPQQERVKTESPRLYARIHPPQMPAKDPVIAEIVARDIQIMLQTYDRQKT
jgi:hypothetical protein